MLFILFIVGEIPAESYSYKILNLLFCIILLIRDSRWTEPINTVKVLKLIVLNMDHSVLFKFINNS